MHPIPISRGVVYAGGTMNNTTTIHAETFAKIVAAMAPNAARSMYALPDMARAAFNAGNYAEAAAVCLKFGIRGDTWRALREAAGLDFSDAANDAEMAAIMAARKAKFSCK